MRWWPLLLLTASSSLADVCQRDFYAQPVVYDRAMAIDFYYTAINLQSTADCAAFCGDRHFCRTAVYNVYAKTCAISYEYTLNCRYNDKRVREFDASSSGSHLIQIACVTKCNENGNRIVQKHRLLAGEPTEFPTSTPAVLRKVQLITGEPNDGLRFPQRTLARNRPSQDAPQEPGFVNKLVIENFTSGGILPVLDSRHTVRRKGQICYRLREKKYLLGAAYEIHKETSLQTCRCLCAHSYDQNSIFMCKSFNWRADGTCELNKANHLGRFDLIDDAKFLYQFIDCDVQVLMNIGTKFCTKDGLAISSTTPTTTSTRITMIAAAPTSLPTTDSSSTTVDFTGAPTDPLTTPETNPPVTSTEAETTTFQSVTEREETTTEKGAETTEQRGKEKTVTSAEEKAGFFVGTRKEKEEEGRQEATTEEGTTTKTTEETTSATEEAVTTDGISTAERTTTGETVTEVTASTEEETKTTSGQTAEGATMKEEERSTEQTVTTTEKAATTAEEVVTTPVTEENTATETLSSSTAELTTATTPESVTETVSPTEEATTENVLHIETGACFERISGHMMASGAAALEHDLSLEECECFCANSRESGRHGFECLSATYYHGERDCVLNLEDRQQKPKEFIRQTEDFNVTYLGMTCTRDKAIAVLVKPDLGYGCRNTQVQLAKPKKNRYKGAFTDECFFELPSHVLEGTALHVETAATPQQCKCLCLAAEQKFGESCQSFQYYYEGAVCLLSKNNRYSNSEKFSALTEQQQQSYFEYRCASKEERLKKYTEQMCLFQKVLDGTHAEKMNNSSSGDIEQPIRTSEDKNLTSIEMETTSLLEGSGMEPNETVVEASTALETTTTTTTELTTTTTSTTTTTTKKHRTPRPINRRIPETEGLEESDFAELESILLNNLEEPTTSSPLLRKVKGVKTVKFTDKVEKAKQEDTTSTSVTRTPTSTRTATPRPGPRVTTRRTTTTTRGPEYPSAGKCTYSALYQTAFFGRRTIKTVHVKTAADCFAACFALHCRSANLIAQGALNQCELFKDSLIDYRRPDMIGYDGSTVYFDGIRCDGL